MYDADGQLLGAKIATDGQWRFPSDSSLPEKFIRCLITFEDKRFYRHPGFDPFSIGRAFWQNMSTGQITSGASTITMQVVRLLRPPKARTWSEKFIEIILATRLELAQTKSNILNIYAQHAPFGGNVVGLEAACWRYFAKAPDHLSWAEAATLAVLPNQPGLIHPGRNRSHLQSKRNRLLHKLQQQNFISPRDLELALIEPLPEAPIPLPRLANHLMQHLQRQHPRNHAFHTTIDGQFQDRLYAQLADVADHLKSKQVHNAAAMIMDMRTGQVKAYVANLPGTGVDHGEYVDCIQAPRSSGSILKPFLYAAGVNEGLISPAALLPDIPTIISGYRPDNFHHQYDGLVPAREALIRSLNIPMVWLLQRYGVDKFLNILEKLHFTSITRTAQDYGLSLILGGAETTLWDLCAAYAYLGRLATHFYELQGEDDYFQRVPIHVLKEQPQQGSRSSAVFSSAAAWLTTQALNDLHRPDENGSWSYFNQHGWLAWKTGTSFGFRDAWAIGVNQRYAAGIWVGNADGEGRPECTGIHLAAPLLMSIFDALPQDISPAPPYDQMEMTLICKQSGYLPNPNCPTDSILLALSAQKISVCSYHQPIIIDTISGYQLNRTCMDQPSWRVESRMILPPGLGYYYQRVHPEYQPPPKFHPACSVQDQSVMDLIYPAMASHLRLALQPVEFQQDIVFRATHNDPDATLFWHLDHQFLGATQLIHHMPLHPTLGPHVLTLLDGQGNQLTRHFTIE